MAQLSEDDDMIVLNMLGSLCEVDRLNEVAKCSLNVFQAQVRPGVYPAPAHAPQTHRRTSGTRDRAPRCVS